MVYIHVRDHSYSVGLFAYDWVRRIHYCEPGTTLGVHVTRPHRQSCVGLMCYRENLRYLELITPESIFHLGCNGPKNQATPRILNLV